MPFVILVEERKGGCSHHPGGVYPSESLAVDALKQFLLGEAKDILTYEEWIRDSSDFGFDIEKGEYGTEEETYTVISL